MKGFRSIPTLNIASLQKQLDAMLLHELALVVSMAGATISRKLDIRERYEKRKRLRQ